MFIQTEQTPNPATLKFLPGREVVPGAAGPVEFTDPERAGRLSPLAARLFAVDGVAGVYLGADFVSVSKAEGQEWHLLKTPVLGAIMEHYLSGDPAVHGEALAAEGAAAPAAGEGDETVRKIKELIDTRVRPAVAQDGGDIVFHGFERGVVYLTMHGACSGCPSSTVTLRNGIENLLRYYVPEVVEVRSVS
jgi:Fe-S cluster biogenesis protein NfuA